MSYGLGMAVTKAPGPLNFYRLVRIEAHEELSALFSYVIDIVSAQTVPAATAFLGKSVSFALGDDFVRRHFNGMVVEFSLLGKFHNNHEIFRLRLAPTLWQTTQQSRSRIFEKQTVGNIIKKVLQDYGDIQFDDAQVSASLPERDYCVQYQETDFNFISRLMEEEGIYYLFDHNVTAGAFDHKLVLSSTTQTYRAAPTAVQELQAGSAQKLLVNEFALSTRAIAPEMQLHDYNYENAPQKLASTVTTQMQGALAGRKTVGYPAFFATSRDGDRLAANLMKAGETAAQTHSGASGFPGPAPGWSTQIETATQWTIPGKMLLTSVTHSASCPIDDAAAEITYSNLFACIADSLLFAPPRRAARGIVPGPQAATVTDINDEKNLGRVRVKFFWDRNSPEGQSCWARVAQGWAGAGYGEQFIPRVDMEVIVVFLDGNPDLPVIVGAVAKQTHKPPYNKDNLTRSGWKTKSVNSSGAEAGGFNELRFEDKDGSEEIYVHAAKDFKADILHDDIWKIENDQTLTVEKNQSVTVNKDQTVTVNKDRSVSIPSGKDSLKVGQTISIEANQSLELKVGTSKILIEPAKITIAAVQIAIEGTAQVQAKAPMVQVNGDGTVIIKGGMVMIN